MKIRTTFRFLPLLSCASPRNSAGRCSCQDLGILPREGFQWKQKLRTHGHERCIPIERGTQLEDDHSSASVQTSQNCSVDYLRQQGVRMAHSSLPPPGAMPIPQTSSPDYHLQATRDKLTASVANLSVDLNGTPPLIAKFSP